MFEINSRVKEKRKDSLYTQEQFGEILGIKTSTYSQMERSEKNIM